MKKVIAFLFVILVLILFVGSIVKIVKLTTTPFRDPDEETTVVEVRKTPELEFKHEVQIEDFLVSVSDNYKIALNNVNDGDIYLKSKNALDIAHIELSGAYLKSLILITETNQKEFEPEKKSTKLNIPRYWNGDEVKCAVAQIDSSECQGYKLFIRFVRE